MATVGRWAFTGSAREPRPDRKPHRGRRGAGQPRCVRGRTAASICSSATAAAQGFRGKEARLPHRLRAQPRRWSELDDATTRGPGWTSRKKAGTARWWPTPMCSNWTDADLYGLPRQWRGARGLRHWRAWRGRTLMQLAQARSASSTPSSTSLPGAGEGFAQSPQAVVFDDSVRVYFSLPAPGTPATANSSARSPSPTSSKDLSRVLGVNTRTGACHWADLGSFDEHGIFPFSPTRGRQRDLGLHHRLEPARGGVGGDGRGRGHQPQTAVRSF